MKTLSFLIIFFVCHLYSIEESIDFGTSKFPLKGYLSLPDKKAEALVVLIAGSGMLDENSTVGPNKIFLDITKYLVKQNIAVFRYPKRIYSYKSHYYTHPPINLKEEVFEDLYLALDTLKTHPKTKDLYIFLIGHSQGGALAAHACKFRKEITGLISLAAPARNVFDVFIDQYEFLSSFKHEYQNKFKHKYETNKHLKNPLNAKKIDKFESMPIIYWNDWNSIIEKAPHTIKDLNKPALVVGFGNDFQVTQKDYIIYKKVLEKASAATTLWMENVSHMLFQSKSKSYKHYFEKNSVYKPLLKTISAWIKDQLDS